MLGAKDEFCFDFINLWLNPDMQSMSREFVYMLVYGYSLLVDFSIVMNLDDEAFIFLDWILIITQLDCWINICFNLSFRIRMQ